MARKAEFSINRLILMAFIITQEFSSVWLNSNSSSILKSSNSSIKLPKSLIAKVPGTITIWFKIWKKLI